MKEKIQSRTIKKFVCFVGILIFTSGMVWYYAYAATQTVTHTSQTDFEAGTVPAELDATSSPGDLKLASTSTSVTQTSDTDFRAGEYPSTTVAGSGDAAALAIANKDFGNHFAWFGTYGSSSGNFTSQQEVVHDVSDNKLFVIDTGNNRVVVMDSGTGGTTLGDNFTTFGTYGTGNGNFSFPLGLDVDTSHNKVFVADTSNARIIMMDSGTGGTTLGDNFTAFGTLGSGSGQFSAPGRLFVDAANNKVYVAENGNRRISVMDSGTGGTTLGDNFTSWANPLQFLRVMDVYVDTTNNKIYGTDYDYNRVFMADSGTGGTTLGDNFTSFGTQGSGSGQFNDPRSVFIDLSRNKLYVADSANDRVDVMDSGAGGTTLGDNFVTFGTEGTSYENFNIPMSVYMDIANHTVFVSDSGNNRIVTFDSGTDPVNDYDPTGSFISSSIEFSLSQDATIAWDDTLPDDTSVSMQTRTSQNSVDLDEFDSGDTSYISDIEDWGCTYDLSESGGILTANNAGCNDIYLDMDYGKPAGYYPVGAKITARIRLTTENVLGNAYLYIDDWNDGVSIDTRNEWVTVEYEATFAFSTVGVEAYRFNYTNPDDKLEIDWIQIEYPGEWSDWSSPCTDSSGCVIENAEGSELVQYRATLATTDTSVTPTINSVTIDASRYTSSATYVSAVIDATSSVDWQTFTATSHIPDGTSLSFQTRTGDTSAPDGTWSSWENLSGTNIVSADAQYLQYQAMFATTDSSVTPILSEAGITYDDGSTEDDDQDDPQAPPAPEIKDITDITKDSLKLEIQVDPTYANQDLDFEIKIHNRDNDDDDTETETKKADESGKLILGISKLESNTEYTISVRFSLKDQDNYSDYSDTEKTKTEKDIEEDKKCTIGNLKARKTNTGAVLTWDRACKEINGILIERKLDDKKFKQIASLDDNDTRYSDDDINAYGTYTYRARGFKGNKFTKYSDEVTLIFQNDQETDSPIENTEEETISPPVDQTGEVKKNSEITVTNGNTEKETALSFAFSKIKEFVGTFTAELSTLAFAGLAAGVAVAGSSSAIPLFATTPQPFSGGMFRLFGVMGLLSKKKKKYEDWGTVFDSETKRPIRGAIISLIDEGGHVVATTTSDSQGRYGFLPNPGNYTIQVFKQNYQLEKSDEQDSLYGDTYAGAVVSITENQVEKVNISLKTTAVDWQDFAKRKIAAYTSVFAIVKRDFFLILFYAGFIISAGIVLMFPSPLNVVIFLIYLGLLAYQLFFKKNAFGSIKNIQTGKPVPFAVVALYKEDNPEQRVAFAVSDVLGRYYLLAENGIYLAKFSGNLLGGKRFEKLIRVQVEDGMLRSDVEV